MSNPGQTEDRVRQDRSLEEQVRDKFDVDLDSLSAPEREALETSLTAVATAVGQTRDLPYQELWRDVAERLRGLESIDIEGASLRQLQNHAVEIRQFVSRLNAARALLGHCETETTQPSNEPSEHVQNLSRALDRLRIAHGALDDFIAEIAKAADPEILQDNKETLAARLFVSRVLSAYGTGLTVPGSDAVNMEVRLSVSPFRPFEIITPETTVYYKSRYGSEDNVSVITGAPRGRYGNRLYTCRGEAFWKEGHRTA